MAGTCQEYSFSFFASCEPLTEVLCSGQIIFMHFVFKNLKLSSAVTYNQYALMHSNEYNKPSIGELVLLEI